MGFLYTIGIRLFTAGLHLAAFFHPKARKWVDGRRDWRRRYAAAFQKTSRVLWVHAASLGEFEQGRPIIEACRERYPTWQIVLTFFSPSGYELRHNYAQADFIAYLPADTPGNAADFLQIIQPDAVIFVKYEFWFNYLAALRQRGAPTLLVSALFRAEQPFFKPWGSLWRRGLQSFTHFFVQNETSATLLQRLGFKNVTVAGDTRVDRVLQIAAVAPGNEVVAAFVAVGEARPSPHLTTHFSAAEKPKALLTTDPVSTARAPSSPTSKEELGGPTLIAGSAWEADEAIFMPWFLQPPTATHWKVIVAPHEPAEKNVERLLQHAGALRYSQADEAALEQAHLLIIDNVGMLNTLYRYGTVAYIGGGFGAGIHNTLEPAAFGLPIIFGPKYTRFEEARAFVARGAGFVVHSAAEFSAVMMQLEDPDFYRQASMAAKSFLAENQGATQRIMGFMATLAV